MRALVQTRGWQAMIKRCNVRTDRRSVQWTALRRADHHLVCRLVHEFQAEPTGFGNHDGGPRHVRDAYNDSPVGPALPAGVREALATLRSTRWRIVEDGRDLHKGSRTMVTFVPVRSMTPAASTPVTNGSVKL